MNDTVYSPPHVRNRSVGLPGRPKQQIRLPAAQRQRQFVQIAFDLIAEKGFEGLRFQDVAERARVNNATLLHQFPSKEALIQGVVRLLVEEMRKERGAPREISKNAIEELRREFEDLAHFIEEVPKFFIVLTEIALRARRDKSIAKIVADRNQFWHGRLQKLLERGITQGVFTAKFNIEAVITSLMAQIKGIAHHASLSPSGRDELSAIVAEIADQVVLRLTAPSKRTKRG